MVTTTAGDSTTGTPNVERTRLLNRMTLLGRDVDLLVESERLSDPVSGRTLSIETTIETGQKVTGSLWAPNIIHTSL